MAPLNSMSKLPEEVLLGIAESMDDNQDVLNLQNTGRPFNRIGVDVLSKRVTSVCVTSTPTSIDTFRKICEHPLLSKRITEVIYVRRPGIYDGFDIVDYLMLRNVMPYVSWRINRQDIWQLALATRSRFFEWFKEGVKSLPNLTRLTYARTWPLHSAWNILESKLRGPYPEALSDDGVSSEDNWCGLRCVLETFKEIRASGKPVTLDLRTPMATGMFGPDMPNLNTLQLKARLVASTMPLLQKLDLDIPWSISASEVWCRGMATILDRAVNPEFLQLQWPYGDCMFETLAVQMMEVCTWPNLRTLHLLRSGALEWLEIDSEYERHDISTTPYNHLSAFFSRHQTIRDLQLRNILIGEFGEDPIAWDARVNDSPALGPLRDILAPLDLQRCSVVLDTFKYIHNYKDMVIMLDEEIETLGEKFGTRNARLKSHHPNIDRSYEFGPWLMQTST